MTNNNGSSASNNGGTNNAWLGFSLSPHSMASAMEDHHHHHVQQQQQQHGFFFPSVTTAATAYGIGAGDAVAAATSGAPYYAPQLASMPLKSDGSLCIMEALRRTDQDHHHG